MKTHEYRNDAPGPVTVQLRATGGFQGPRINLKPGGVAMMDGPDVARWWLLPAGAPPVTSVDDKAQTRSVLENLVEGELLDLLNRRNASPPPMGTPLKDLVDRLDHLDIRDALRLLAKYRLVNIAGRLGVSAAMNMRKEELVEEIIRWATHDPTVAPEDRETPPDLLIQSGYEEATVALDTWPAPSASVLASIRRAAEQLGYDARYGRTAGRWRAEVATKRGAASQVVDVSLAQTYGKRDDEWWAGFSALGLVEETVQLEPPGRNLTPLEVKALAAAVQRP